MTIDAALTAGGGFVIAYVPVEIWLIGGVILPPIAGVLLVVGILSRLGVR
jgi:hypothetical protein